MGISSTDILLFVPEIVLTATIIALFVGDLLIGSEQGKRRILTGLTVTGLVVTGMVVYATAPQLTSIFHQQIAIDPLSRTFKLLFVGITVVGVFTSLLSAELPGRHLGEYYALLVSVALGMFLMAGANDLLMAYLGLEMVSIVSYAMAGYRLHDRRSSEAALKYVVYGGGASGLMLFGISMFYGMYGTTEITAVHHAMNEWARVSFTHSVEAGQSFPLTLLCAFVLLFAGVGYKIAVVPFHMWSPDVYEGSPTPFTGFLSVGPKAAGFALLMRLFIGHFVAPGAVDGPGYLADAQGMMAMAVDLPLPAMLGAIAALTMTLGNLAALPQNNVKRLLAYSSIAHAGYILLGFVVLSEASMHAVLIYLVIYYLMNLGAFTVVQIVRDSTGGELIHDFRGLGHRNPLNALFMTIFLLSLTGLPPLAGFVGKFYLFSAVIAKGGTALAVLAVIGVINSAVSLAYYLKVVKAMWLSEPPTGREPAPVSRAYTVITGLLAVPVLVLGIYWAPLSSSLHGSLAFYRSPAPPTATAKLPAHPGAER